MAALENWDSHHVPSLMHTQIQSSLLFKKRRNKQTNKKPTEVKMVLPNLNIHLFNRLALLLMNTDLLFLGQLK